MKYTIGSDIFAVCKLLNISYSQLSEELNVARSTVSRIVKEEIYPSDLILETFYSFVYKNRFRKIQLNQLKSQFAKDQYQLVLFHGSKTVLEGNINLNHSRDDVDFGKGFYIGESYEQAASYVYPFKQSSVYIIEFLKSQKLKIVEFDTSLEWMLLVSYYRGHLNAYKNSKTLTNILERVKDIDLIIAPIADNNMYEIMNRFAKGEITDLQATSALSASGLGKQYVLKSDEACFNAHIVNRLYLSAPEREDIAKKNSENALVSFDKARLAIQMYRGKGKYIEEILND